MTVPLKNNDAYKNRFCHPADHETSIFLFCLVGALTLLSKAFKD